MPRATTALLATAVVLVLASPDRAHGGGVSVITPARTSPESCQRGSPAEWRGGADPEATVIECLRLPSRTIQISAHFFRKRGRQLLCHYAAAAGFADVDGVCGPIDLLSSDGLSGDIMRLSIFRHESEGPAYVSGLVSRFVRGVRVEYSLDGQRLTTAAGATQIGREIGHFVRPRRRFAFFAAELPLAADTCGIFVTAEGYPGELRDAVRSRAGIAHFAGVPLKQPGSTACRRLGTSPSASPAPGEELIRSLLSPLAAIVTAALDVLKASAPTTSTPSAPRATPTPGTLRAALVEGVRQDLSTADDQPRDFGSCLLRRLTKHELSEDRLDLLAALAETGELRNIAQALNMIAAPAGDRCGGRRHVPELTTAAQGFYAIAA